MSTSTNSLINNSLTSSSPAVSTYLGSGNNNIPGILQIFYAPSEFYYGIKASIQAFKIGDREGIFENILRVTQAPLNFIASTAQVSWIALKIGVFFEFFSGTLAVSLSHLSKSITIAGFVICAIEGSLELFGLCRSINFLNKTYPFGVEKLNSESRCEAYLEKLRNIQRRYFHLSLKRMEKIEQYTTAHLSHLSLEDKRGRKEKIKEEILARKKSNLDRRVHSWLADEIQSTLPHLIRDLQDPHLKEQTIPLAANLFEQIKEQSQKKFLIHTAGIVAVLLTVIGLITSLITCPFLVPITLLFGGAGISLTRYCLDVGLFHSKGWNFNARACIPQPILMAYDACMASSSVSQSLPVKQWEFQGLYLEYLIEKHPFYPFVIDYTLSCPEAI